MSIVVIVVFILIVIGIITSLHTLWSPQSVQRHILSFEALITLVLVYSTVLVGFALIYTVLEMHGVDLLRDGNVQLSRDFPSHFMVSLYFSGATLFSLGYGDVVPIGIGRVLAIMEALVGYTMPAAFVVHSIMDVPKKNK